MKLFVMIRDHVITFHASQKQTSTIIGLLNLDLVLLEADNEQNSRNLVFTSRENNRKQLSLLCENESVYKEWKTAISNVSSRKSMCLNCMHNTGKYSSADITSPLKDNLTYIENTGPSKKTVASLASRRASLSDTSFVRTEVSVSEIRAIYDNPPSQSHTRRSSMSSFSSDTLHKIKVDTSTDSLAMAKLNIDFSDLSAKYKELKKSYKAKCDEFESLHDSSTKAEQQLHLQVLILTETIAKEKFEKESTINQFKSLNDQYQMQLAAQNEESDKLRMQLKNAQHLIQQAHRKISEFEVGTSSKQHPIQLTTPLDELLALNEYKTEIERLNDLLLEQEKSFDKERASFKARSNSSIFKVAELEVQLKEKVRSTSYINDQSTGRDQPQVPKRRGSSITLSDAAASDIKRCMDTIAQKDSDILRLKNIVNESKSSVDDLQQQLLALHSQLQDVRMENETLKFSLAEPTLSVSQHRKVRSLDISSTAVEKRRSILFDDSNLERNLNESRTFTSREESVNSRYVVGPSDFEDNLILPQMVNVGKSSTIAMLFDAMNDTTSANSRRNSPLTITTTFEVETHSPRSHHRRNLSKDFSSSYELKSSVDFNIPESVPSNSLEQEQFDSSIIKRPRLAKVRASKYRSFIASSTSAEFSSTSWAALESQTQPLRMLSQKHFSSTTEEDSFTVPAKTASSIRKSFIEDAKSSTITNTYSSLPPLLDYSHNIVPMNEDGDSNGTRGEKKIEKHLMSAESGTDVSGRKSRSASIHRRNSENIFSPPSDPSFCSKCKSMAERGSAIPSIPDKFNRRLIETYDSLPADETAGAGFGSSGQIHYRLSKKFLYFPLELSQRDYFHRVWEILGDGIRNRLLQIFMTIQLSYPSSGSSYSPGAGNSASSPHGRGLASPNKPPIQNSGIGGGNKSGEIIKGSVPDVLPSAEFYDTHALLNLLLLTHISSNSLSRPNPGSSSPNVFSPSSNSNSNHQSFISMRLIYSELMKILRLQNIQPIIAAAKSLLAIYSRRCERRAYFDCDDCGRLLEPDHPDLKEFFDSARYLITSIAVQSVSSSTSPPNDKIMGYK